MCNLCPFHCMPISFPSALSPNDFGLLNMKSLGNKSFIISDFIVGLFMITEIGCHKGTQFP